MNGLAMGRNTYINEQRETENIFVTYSQVELFVRQRNEKCCLWLIKINSAAKIA